MMVVPLELVTILVYLSMEAVRLESKERVTLLRKWVPVLSWLFFSLSLVLCLCVYFLLNRLFKKRDQVKANKDDKSVFNREIRALLVILVIFSSTYIMRGIWDLE